MQPTREAIVLTSCAQQRVADLNSYVAKKNTEAEILNYRSSEGIKNS